ncbi:MAG: ABC transporter permease [bacterium]|nr:ABC transporter permease [bacterium]
MRLIHLIKKEFIEIFRQKELLPLLFVAPLIQIVVLGYVVKTDIEKVPVEIANLSSNKAAVRIINRIERSPLFDVKRISYRPKDYVETLKRGKVTAVILFRDRLDGVDGRTKRENPLKYPEIQILMDGIDSNTSSIAAGYFNGIIRRYILADIEKMGMGRMVENKTLIRFNPRLKSINYMGPGIVALLLTILTLFFTSVSIVREKEQQTMDTLLVSRLTPVEIYIGKAMPMAIIALVDMFLGLAVVVFWFEVPVRGNILYLVLAAVVFLAALLSYALMISTIASTQQQALFFAWFSMVSFILLSGLFTPTENVPEAFQFLVKINPLVYLIKIIREVFLKGTGIEFFYKDLLSLTGIAAVIISISLLNFKRFVSR